MIKIVNTDNRKIALAREISAEQQRYHKLKSKIRQKLESSRFGPVDSLETAQLFEDFRDELAMHFALETASESLRDAINSAPHLNSKVVQLIREQEILYTEMCDLADLIYDWLVSSDLPVSRHFIARWQQLDSRLRRHDAIGRELIYESLFVDIGSYD